MIGGKRKIAPIAMLPGASFEYETNVIHTGPDDDLCRLDDFLNAKAANGWRVHTCQRIGDGSYFLVLDKLKRE